MFRTSNTTCCMLYMNIVHTQCAVYEHRGTQHRRRRFNYDAKPIKIISILFPFSSTFQVHVTDSRCVRFGCTCTVYTVHRVQLVFWCHWRVRRILVNCCNNMYSVYFYFYISVCRSHKFHNNVYVIYA